MLIPFDGTFESHRDPVPILIQKSSDQYDRTDNIQNWRNGNEFLFLDGKDDVAGLESEGKVDKAKGDLHNAAGNVKDAARDLSKK
jgi:hypothetical protein